MLRDAWFIAKSDLSYLLKQKETLVWVFLMPFVFFYFIGTVTGGSAGMGTTSSKPDSLAVYQPGEGGYLVHELFEALEAENYALVEVQSLDELEEYTRRLILPEAEPGFENLSESLNAGNAGLIRFVRDGAGTRANLDQLRLGRAVYGLLADVVVLRANGEALSREAIDKLQAMPRALSLEVKPAGKRVEIPSGYSQTIPGTMVMFTLMLLLTSGAVLLVIERERGLLRRLAAAPLSKGSLVLGKWMGKMGLAIVQLSFAMVAGTLFFGVDWGDHLPMVALVVFAWAAFCTSLAIFLANLVRTEGQMVGIGVLSSMLLAALGGCWWPIEVTADWMQALASWLPTGWTMNAMHQLVNFGSGPESAVQSLVLLAVGALLLGALAARNFRYS